MYLSSSIYQPVFPEPLDALLSKLNDIAGMIAL